MRAPQLSSTNLRSARAFTLLTGSFSICSAARLRVIARGAAEPVSNTDAVPVCLTLRIYLAGTQRCALLTARRFDLHAVFHCCLHAAHSNDQQVRAPFCCITPDIRRYQTLTIVLLPVWKCCLSWKRGTAELLRYVRRCIRTASSHTFLLRPGL